ncbi:hypothetical protein EXIGLDRAFT_769629 [Exidia glandulosa HHB12029]|uniref:Sodium/calcium exchanger membrane region domain-containing protein n=1 Tax=Exidia glandulosa HHB12029 TaxID=1314781 RepID=A0A165HCU1_EXIGL|nr:hypothetical protein EXIGLDRAFT_769629 [Exidia glandulosa HHB12029]
MGNFLSGLILLLSPPVVEDWRATMYLSLGLIGCVVNDILANIVPVAYETVMIAQRITSTLPHLTVVIQVVVTISQAMMTLTIVAACVLIFNTHAMSGGDLETYINDHPVQARLPALCFFAAATSLLVAASIVHYRAVIAAGAIILAFFAWQSRAQVWNGVKSLYSNVVDRTTQVLRGRRATPAPETAEP